MVNQPTKDVKPDKPSKSVQTYMRLQAKVKEKDVDVSETRDSKLRRPPVDSRNLRHKDIRISATYDYLATPRRYSSRAIDVRYLSDVTRCLRDTLRQICDDQTQVCPNIQSRYSRHRREHHHDYMEPRSSTDSNHIETPVSVPMVSRGVSCSPSCDATASTYIPTCPPQPSICCFCQEPLPCGCIASEEEKFLRKLEELVISWMQELPVFSNDTPQNRKQRQDMVLGLIENLKGLNQDEYFEENAKNEITECVNNLPMWCPGDKREQSAFMAQIIDNLMIKLRTISSKSEECKEEIAKWLDDITFKPRDSRGQIVDKNVTKSKLVNKLQALVAIPTDEVTKSEVINLLNEFPLKVEGDRVTYIDNLAQMLTDKLKTLPTEKRRRESGWIREEFEKQVWDWVKGIPGFFKNSSSNVKENRTQVEMLTYTLQKLQAQGIEKKEICDEMQIEINSWLERNTKNLDQRAKKGFSEKLLQNLIKTSKAGPKIAPTINKNVLTGQILEWLEEIPDLLGSKSENQITAEILASKLEKLQLHGKDESDFEREIFNWLVNTLKGKRRHLDTKNVNQLVKKLLGKLSTAQDDEVITNDILNVLDEIPDLNITSDDRKKLASQLTKKIRELQSRGEEDVSKESFTNEINDFLSNLSETVGIKLSFKHKDKLVNKLFSVVKITPKQRKRWSKQGDLKKSIDDQISQILEDTLGLDDDNKIQNIQNKISDLITRNIDQIQSSECDDVLREIADILEEEAGIPTRKAKQIADQIITKALSLPSRLSISQEIEFKTSLKDEVNNILGDSEIENKEEVEATIANILADQALRGENDGETKKRLIDVLKNSNLSEVDSRKIADQLMGKSKEISLSYKLQPHIDQESTQNFKKLSPMRKQMFVDSAQNEILDFTENLTGDNSELTAKKWTVAAAELAERVGDIISDADTTSTDKRQLLNEEILQYMKNLDMQVGPQQTEEAKKLVDRLQNLAYTTSTPRSSNVDKGKHFRLHKESQDITLSTIAEDSTFSQYKKQQPRTKQEKQYMSELETKIDHWLQTLPINFDTEDVKGFKETMIRDLADDVVDRQKYLQLNPNAKTSDDEELEYLKYQVFRWLNKLPDVKQLMPSIAKTNELMKLMKGVPVPQLIKDKKTDRNAIRDSYSKQVSKLISIQDELSKWMDALPSQFFKSKDKIYQKQMIKELADNIDEYQKNNTLTETALDDVILKWLQKMINDSKQSLKNKSDNLKATLVDKGIVSFSDDKKIIDDSSTTQNNYLYQDSAIDEWMKSLPLKTRRTSTDMRQMDKIKKDLIENLKNTQVEYSPGSTGYDKKMKEIIEKCLQLLPLEPTKQKDKAFLQQKVDELFDIMKESQSKRFSLSNTALKNAMDDWARNLPFQPGKSKNDINRDIDEFIFTVKETFKTKDVDDMNSDLEDQVKALLKRLPLKMNLVNDGHAQDLMYKLQELMKFATKPSAKNGADIFYNDIESWCDSLPISGGDTPEEIERIKAMKQNIVSKLLNKIGDFNMKPDIFHDDTLYEDLLKDEIDDLLGTLPQTPELLNNIESLKDNLLQKLKHAKQKAENEFAGHAYKQQLRDAISTTLPSIENVALEEQVPFEILKDTVADAFINLHYSPDSESKAKYKQKIGDEINKFCNDYLKRFPSSPMDPKKLNLELFTALQKVPKPKDDTIKSQVEQVRIKEHIYEWLNDIPLEDENPSQQLQKNKIVSVLANALHGTEKEKVAKPDIDAESRMKQDIKKWIKKLPLKPEAKINTDEQVDKLIERLKSTEDTRRFSISNLKNVVGPTTESKLSQYQPQIPPSTLSKEDRAHLERIRQRNQRSPCRISPPICLCKDASVSPIPVDVSSQTNMGISRRQPLSPSINVNEFNWESAEEASRIWETQNGSELQSQMHRPSMLGRNYPDANQQQIQSQYLLPQDQSLTRSQPLDQSSSSLKPQNQNGSLQATPCVRMPPCITNPPWMPQSVQPCARPPPPCAQPEFPCAPPPPCISPRPPCTPLQKLSTTPPSFMSSAPCENQQPPYFQPPSVQQPCFQPPIQPPPCLTPSLATSPQPCVRSQPPCIPQSPCATSPCIPHHSSNSSPSTPQTGYYCPTQIPPCLSQDAASGVKQRRTPKKPQFCLKSSDLSTTSSPAEEFGQGRSFRCPPRVTRLGSLDNVPPCMVRSCGSQSPGDCKSRGSPDDECEWVHIEDYPRWGMPCPRRPTFRVPIQSAEFRKCRNVDKFKCHCKERCLGKCDKRPRGCNQPPCLTTASMKQCSKCCGVHCPHPSYLFFR